MGNQTMAMDSPQEFFVHEMQDLLGAEQLVLKTLPKLIESAGDKEVKAALKEYEQVFDLGAAAKAEHYEIVSYSGLVDMARLMGQKDVAKLLQENLKQEQAMAKLVEGFATQLGKELLGPIIAESQSESVAVGK